MLVSPAEQPLPLRRLGQSSSVPERYGLDFMWVANGCKHGVQRKEMKDFVASVIDGRLAKEVGQMAQVDGIKCLAVEGRPIWSNDGMWMGPVRWDRFRHRQALFTLQHSGIWVVGTDSIADTAEVVLELERWTKKPKHQFASVRSKVVGQWGDATSREFGLHVLQSFPGVGREMAERIWGEFGRVPLMWTVTEQELLGIDGIGPKRATQMMRAFSVTPDPSDDAPKVPGERGEPVKESVKEKETTKKERASRNGKKPTA